MPSNNLRNNELGFTPTLGNEKFEVQQGIKPNKEFLMKPFFILFTLLVLGMVLLSCENSPTDPDYPPLSATFLSYPDENNISTLVLNYSQYSGNAGGLVKIKNTGTTGIDFYSKRIEDLPEGASSPFPYMTPSEIVGAGETSTVTCLISTDDLSSGTYNATLVLRGCEYTNGSGFLNNTITKTLAIRFVKP